MYACGFSMCGIRFMYGMYMHVHVHPWQVEQAKASKAAMATPLASRAAAPCAEAAERAWLAQSSRKLPKTVIYEKSDIYMLAFEATRRRDMCMHSMHGVCMQCRHLVYICQRGQVTCRADHG